ncbi:hypothetical protein EMA8858_03811 [Emticicia aquatica]|uniref:Uncharacterized protein n=1 Tax=Emticicia aquatica TaxID=1681835 RepID=A0ABM9AVH2_9BACT|nr:hypothetical protein [Emticicia aquatica]CAH0997677.1 hypothetical protein EMA8858_03811 [Emticicia aquatica]
MKIDIFHKGLLSFAFVVVCGSVTMAQVKIGNNPTTLSPSAILEMESTNRGMLLPRLSLGSTVSAEMGSSTTKTAVVGMTVYNTNAGISGSATYPANGAGIYYFDGTGWVYGGLPTGGTSGQILSRTATGLSWSDAASGIATYSVGSSTGAGAMIKATGLGVTMAVDVNNQLVTFSVPNGVELLSVRLYDLSANAGTTSSYGLTGASNFLNIKYQFANTAIATNYATTILPQIQVFLDGGTPLYLDTYGTGYPRQYTLAGTPSGNNYTVRIQLMDPNTLGNKWIVLMNF